MVASVASAPFHRNEATRPRTAAASPCTADSNYQRLAFWVGDWEVFDSTGAHYATQRVRTVIDACAITAEWTGRVGDKGMGMSAFDVRTGEWRQMYVANQVPSPSGVDAPEVRSVVQRAGRPFHSAARSSGWGSRALACDDHAIERPSRAAAVRGFVGRREDVAHALQGRTPPAADRRAVTLARSGAWYLATSVTLANAPDPSRGQGSVQRSEEFMSCG